MAKYPYITKTSVMKVVSFSSAIIIVLAIPQHRASAGILSFLGIGNNTPAVVTPIRNSQTMSLLEANIAQADTTPSTDVPLDKTAITPETNLGGEAIATDTSPYGDQISIYTVHSGDTVKSVAKMFGVTESTIRWANDLSLGDKLIKDQVLTILPINGVQYTIKKGDTFKSLAKKFSADASEIAQFNDMALTEGLVVGDSIIIPDGEIATPVIKAPTPPKYTYIPDTQQDPTKPQKTGDTVLPRVKGPYDANYYIRPVQYPLTQGAHGKNGLAVDIGAPKGTPIVAMASGKVIVAKTTGYNGGYAEYVVIAHDNGQQTLYAHMSKVLVSAGDVVTQGQVIGLVGSTGNSTGPHLHIEVRGGRNPMTVDRNYGLKR